MSEIDVNHQWSELQADYAAMADEELEAVAQEAYDLTDIARQALQAEISRRHLNIALLLQAPAESEISAEEQSPIADEDGMSEDSHADSGPPDEEILDYNAHCPKCHSTEIVFRRLDKSHMQPGESPQFSWQCDSCGYKWKDDGFESQN